MASHGSPQRRRFVNKPELEAADATVSLPDELIFNILSWLPLNSVCRFPCVCRRWRALVLEPAFIEAHMSHHAEPLIVVRSSQKYPLRRRDLHLMDMDGNIVRVMKGLGGIGFLSTSMDDKVCVTDSFSGSAHVIDLAAGEVLVDCPKPKQHHVFIFGFGRAVPSGKYKVVRLQLDQTCEVLTIGGHYGWRSAPAPPAVISFERCSPVAVNGVMYFLISKSRSDDRLHCLDLESEQWKEPIEGPMNTMIPEPWKRTGIARITELNGYLCVVRLETQITVWLMTESTTDRWLKAYTIPKDPSIDCCKPLRMTSDGGKVIFYSSDYRQGPVIKAYDPRTNTCTTRGTLGRAVKIVRVCSLKSEYFF